MNKFDYIKLTPFKWFVLENFPFIEADFDALTEWQLFCKLGKEINKIVNSENVLGEQVENLTDAFIELQNYVNNYFDNLDVQDEINNKLNEMAESGELAEIISQYLQLQITFTYNSVAEMKSAENLINGSFAQTFGYNNYGDGGKALYKIRTITNEDVVDEMFIIALSNNTLVAELIEDNIINVHCLGIFGDNTDKTSKLTYILGKELNYYFPSGTYNINSIINLKSHKLIGNNTEKPIFKNIGLNNHEMFNANDLINLEIKNIIFDFGEAKDIVKTSINIYNSKNINITESEFKNGHGSQFRINESENILIENCLFHDITGDTGNMGNCLYFHPVRNATITRCECYNVREDFIYLDGDVESPVENVYINNNVIKLTGFENTDASSNGIGINGNCKHIIISNNTINNNINGIKTDIRYDMLPEDISIINNIISNNSQNGLTIKSNNTFINNNNIGYNGQDGINVNGCENVTLESNNIYNNTREGLIAHTLNYLFINNCNFYNNKDGLTMGSSNRNVNHVYINNSNAYNNTNFGFQIIQGTDIKITTCKSNNNTTNWDVSRFATDVILQLIPEFNQTEIRSITYTNAKPTQRKT